MNNTKVLLIEDDEQHLDIIANLLQSSTLLQVIIETAGTFEKAQKMILEEKYDAILSDLSLPDSTYNETLQRLLGIVKDAPILVLTSLDDRNTIMGMIKGGADDCIPKSQLNSALLERSIMYCIDRFKKEQTIRQRTCEIEELNKSLQQQVDERTRNLHVKNETLVKEVAERRKAEEEITKLLSALEIKNEELQSIVYISSHDLRSPIINIEGFCGILSGYLARLQELCEAQNLPSDIKLKITCLFSEDISETIHYIKEGIKKMKALFGALLQVSRIGRTNLNVQDLNMNRLIQGITDAMSFEIQQSDVTVIYEDLPPCSGDEGQINQLFTNLIGNAIKYHSPERKCLIQISGRTENGQIVYCIEDNGIGIALKYHKKIFEIFQRLNPKGDITGEGIGLSIVKRIINKHNGRIWVESEPDKGSKFFISLAAGK